MDYVKPEKVRALRPPSSTPAMGKGDTKAGGFLAPKVNGQQRAAALGAPASARALAAASRANRQSPYCCALLCSPIASGAVVLVPRARTETSRAGP
jgi:hypothetical protein